MLVISKPLSTVMISPLLSYPLALLKLMEQETNVAPLGMARRVGTATSTFDVPAHNLLLALLEHAPSPENIIAKEVLVELGGCGNETVVLLAEMVIVGTCDMTEDDWAGLVHEEMQKPGNNFEGLTKLASHYLSHLLIACMREFPPRSSFTDILPLEVRNPGGPKTPQDTIHPTPDRKRIEEIEDLIKQAAFLRDGDYCLITSASFIPPDMVVARCAHIIPFSLSAKTQTHAAIEGFAGLVLSAQFVSENINHPRNALNLQNDAHDLMAKYMAWGIEAKYEGNEWKYYYRIVRPDRRIFFATLKDGDAIVFGSGPGGTHIPPPDPRMCNLRLAVSRVAYASGASEIFDKFVDDEDEDMMQVPVYFGGPFVSDDVLMRKLEVAMF
ncbi:hypothetical protein D9615_005978 [Tricholomella constricta]|uniref:HNH nuclease domain-containing protein n=1 Tax=Tricholomella constricta TaxID=117010 RepID=A0A8H5M332_9AGAR|nr:hypothetical protein D9615_005978 [Tricholomella constricta]